MRRHGFAGNKTIKSNKAVEQMLQKNALYVYTESAVEKEKMLSVTNYSFQWKMILLSSRRMKGDRCDSLVFYIGSHNCLVKF